MHVLSRPAVVAETNAKGAADYYRRTLRNCVRDSAAELAPLGGGDTWARFRYLRDVARADLSLARLLEGHLDATAILHEAGRSVDADLTYAIWASGGPTANTYLLQTPDGLALAGSKPFCSGADLVDRALVHTDASGVLVDAQISTAGSAISYQKEAWVAPAFSSIHTWTSEFHDLALAGDAQIEQPQWYFRRAGFWQGALGPAACWAGGAIGLVDHARKHCSNNAHACAHLGELLAAERCMNSMLKCAAEDIDRDPSNRSGEAYPRALAVRHSIERLCHLVMDHFGRLLGPRPLAFDAHITQHYAELTLYVRQCHAQRDLEELGQHAIETTR